MAQITVVGHEEINKALSEFERAMQKKILKAASKHVLKTIVEPSYKNRVPVFTGAMKRSIVIRVKGGRKGRIGFALFIDAKKLARQRNAKTATRKALRSEIRDKETGVWRDFFYPPLVEFGTKRNKGTRPLYRALITNKRRILREYVAKVKNMADLGGNRTSVLKQIRSRRRLATRELQDL